VFVLKARQALTFLATIESESHTMRKHDVIRSGPLMGALGARIMLSLDQFLRLISLPAIVAALLIASQISGVGTSKSAQVQATGE
jgi:hypothetical protein